MNSEIHSDPEYFDQSALIPYLHAIKALIDRNIWNYPAPIAGSDIQVTIPLEEGTKYSRNLAYLETLSNQSLEASNKAHSIIKLVWTLECLGKEA